MRKSEALKIRARIEEAVQSLDTAAALEVITLHPAWTVGMDCAVGLRVQHAGGLYECLQAHTALAGWEPDTATAALWRAVNETHAGTLEDPIPYEGNMALVSGLYYTQGGVLYLCIRDTGIPVYAALRDLIELYVEEVRDA